LPGALATATPAAGAGCYAIVVNANAAVIIAAASFNPPFIPDFIVTVH